MHFSGERTRPRVLSLAPRQRLSSVNEEGDFGEAPKSAREARALPGPESQLQRPKLPRQTFSKKQMLGRKTIEIIAHAFILTNSLLTNDYWEERRRS